MGLGEYCSGMRSFQMFVFSSLTVLGGLLTPSTGHAYRPSGCPEQVYDGNFSGAPSQLAGYTRVTGTVSIDHYPEYPIDLSGMECLEVIDGDFKIKYTTYLETLDGVHNLREVGGELVLQKLANLESVAGLTSLETVGEQLYMRDLPQLTSLDGLGSLSTVGGDFNLLYTGVEDLDGLEALTTVWGDRMWIMYNDALASVEGLSNLEWVEWLRIYDCDALESLDGLEGLESYDKLYFSHNDSLTNVNAVALLKPPGGVRFYQNFSLDQCYAASVGLGMVSVGTPIAVIANLWDPECRRSCSANAAPICWE